MLLLRMFFLAAYAFLVPALSLLQSYFPLSVSLSPAILPEFFVPCLNQLRQPMSGWPRRTTLTTLPPSCHHHHHHYAASHLPFHPARCTEPHHTNPESPSDHFWLATLLINREVRVRGVRASAHLSPPFPPPLPVTFTLHLGNCTYF